MQPAFVLRRWVKSREDAISLQDVKRSKGTAEVWERHTALRMHNQVTLDYASAVGSNDAIRSLLVNAIIPDNASTPSRHVAIIF
jgi:hypothetical protein